MDRDPEEAERNNDPERGSGCDEGHDDLEPDEWIAWMKLTPAQRFREQDRLWATYLALGGSLDPEPDSQSPFDFPELERAVPPDGRAGVRFVRRGGVQS